MNDSFIKTHVHSSPLCTETEAATKVAPTVDSMKARIMYRLKEQDLDGLTPDEFCEEINGLINTVRRRFTDLWKEGKVRHHPNKLTRQNNSGNDCVVWVIGEDPERKPSRMELLKADNKRLRSLLVSHGIDPNQDELPF